MSIDINQIVSEMNARAFVSLQRETEERRKQFIEDCFNASIVRTAGGDAVLIGGSILQITCPDPAMIDWLVLALRAGRPGINSANMTAAEATSKQAASV